LGLIAEAVGTIGPYYGTVANSPPAVETRTATPEPVTTRMYTCGAPVSSEA
jgi:hypothetical protein